MCDFYLSSSTKRLELAKVCEKAKICEISRVRPE